MTYPRQGPIQLSITGVRSLWRADRREEHDIADVYLLRKAVHRALYPFRGGTPGQTSPADLSKNVKPDILQKASKALGGKEMDVVGYNAPPS